MTYTELLFRCLSAGEAALLIVALRSKWTNPDYRFVVDAKRSPACFDVTIETNFPLAKAMLQRIRSES